MWPKCGTQDGASPISPMIMCSRLGGEGGSRRQGSANRCSARRRCCCEPRGRQARRPTASSKRHVLLAPAIAHDLPGGASELRAGAARALAARLVNVAAASPAPLQVLRTEVKFGTSTRPFHVAVARLYECGGRFAGTVSLATPSACRERSSRCWELGITRRLNGCSGCSRPARRPGAVMFVDLEGSAQLARRLSTQAFFALIRRLIFRIDEEVVSRGGVVGKHAGDGASAFFLQETFGREAAAARVVRGSSRDPRAYRGDRGSVWSGASRARGALRPALGGVTGTSAGRRPVGAPRSPHWARRSMKPHGSKAARRWSGAGIEVPDRTAVN